MYSRLQYISQGGSATEQIRLIKEVADAGCSWVQLRFKEADENTFLRTAESVKKLSVDYDFTFIINDHPFIARKVDADGVHLGWEDMDIQTARNILGDKKIIGGTANTMQQVSEKIASGVNYIGLGPYRFTNTKEKLSPVLGLGGYQGIMQVLQENKVKVPVYGIGGLITGDIAELVKCGIYGIAVSGLLVRSENKIAIVKELNQLLYGKTYHREERI